MANSLSKKEITNIGIMLAMTVGKQGIDEKWVKEWLVDTIKARANQEGWGHLLTIADITTHLEQQ